MQHTALVCTHGFADVLTLGRQNRADPYALHVGESPWVAALPDAWRVEVPGRINAAGHEVTPLDLPALLARLAALPHAPTHVAICLLHALRNPAHEQQVRAALQARWPGLAVTCSHDVPADGEHAGEFERTVATLRTAGLAEPARPASHTTAAPGLAAQLESLANAMQACLVAQAVSSVVREAMDWRRRRLFARRAACWRRPVHCPCCWAACRRRWPGCWTCSRRRPCSRAMATSATTPGPAAPTCPTWCCCGPCM